MMDPLDVAGLREALQEGRIQWRKHVLQRLAERGIRQQQVIGVVLTGECIRQYPEDAPFPSGLFLGWVESRPLHVVAAYDLAGHRAFIITAYEPLLDYFEPDFKTRKKP